MACFRSSLTDNPGVDHFSLPSDPGLLARLVATWRDRARTGSSDGRERTGSEPVEKGRPKSKGNLTGGSASPQTTR